MDKQIHVQVALLSLSFLTCFAPARACSLCTFPSIIPPSLLPSLLSSPCVCLCSSSCSCLIFLETNYRALQEEKKKQGEQFGQRASRFLLPHFHEDHVFSLQVLFFSLTPLSLFHSLYICLCPSLICIPLSAPHLLCLSNRLLNPPVMFFFRLWTVALKISSDLYKTYQTECVCLCMCVSASVSFCLCVFVRPVQTSLCIILQHTHTLINLCVLSLWHRLLHHWTAICPMASCTWRWAVCLASSV